VDEVDELMTELRGYLSQPVRLPYQASAIVKLLFLLSSVYHLENDPGVAELGEAFSAAYDAGLRDELLANQVRYASRLATAPGKLIYEEMFKLFSLLEEIHALRVMGYAVDESLLQQMEADVRARFSEQRKLAQLIAEDGVKEWNRSLWWYAENLRKPGSGGRPIS
jgi:hypothetical protein